MKSKLVGLWLFLFTMALPVVVAFADGATPTIEAPAIAVPPGAPWWASMLAAIVPLLLGALTALSAYVSSFVNRKIKEVKTSEYNQWYGMVLNLAGIAVRYAETNFGPDTGKGNDKKQLAIDWLMSRLKALDPKISEHIDRSQIAAFVDAAYHDVFVALRPLAGPAALAPVK